MGYRNVVALSLGALVAVASGAAWAKGLIPATVVPTSTTAVVAPPASPSSRVQRSSSTAYVPGFDIGSHRGHRRPSVSSTSSTIPGAPQY